jgi:photosystem II stability/assembly factor-like uncharacterized protein
LARVTGAGRRIALLLACLATTAAAGQHNRADRGKDSLYGAAFVDAQVGWAVGAFGTILRTRDGGATWERQASGTTDPLFAAAFTDPRRGWVVGRSGLILHTADGGAAWTPQPSGVDKHLFRVHAVDAHFACAVGDWGVIVVTRDGGATWEDRSLPRDVILNDVFFLDRQRGWIVGELGAVVVTEDGGQTWTERDSGIGKTLFGVEFVTPERGWAVGIDALIVRTDDGGRTWQVQHGSTEPGALEQVGFAQAYDNPSLYALAMAGERGFAVGDIGAIFTSADGGQSWTRQAVPAEWGLRWFRDVAVVSGTHGAIIGAEGWRVTIRDGRVDLPTGQGHAATTVH